jgi:ABC-type sugar transport system substrate-binding protein
MGVLAVRATRVLLAAALLAAVVAPAAHASRQLLCRHDRTIYTTDMTITYPWWEICG